MNGLILCFQHLARQHTVLKIMWETKVAHLMARNEKEYGQGTTVPLKAMVTMTRILLIGLHLLNVPLPLNSTSLRLKPV